MFYPCEVATGGRGDSKQGVVVLTPAESRRLLAKAVAALPEVRNAYTSGRLAILSGGTTSFVLEELTGEKLTVPQFSMGMNADGGLTSSLPEGRVNGRCFVNGEKVDIPYPDFVKTMGRGDAIVKGANAVDASGTLGILLSNENGGAIGSFFGSASARGVPVISPVGLEKTVWSVAEAAQGWGQSTLDYVMGIKVGYAVVTNALVVTEIQALAVLAGVKARIVGSGGIEGNEGSVILVIEGAPADFEKAIALVVSIKGEPRIAVPHHQLKP
jgi:hypothetical protein